MKTEKSLAEVSSDLSFWNTMESLSRVLPFVLPVLSFFAVQYFF